LRTRPLTAASFHHALSSSLALSHKAHPASPTQTAAHSSGNTAALSFYTVAAPLGHDLPPLRRPRPVFPLTMDSRPPRPLIHNPNHQSSSSSSSSSQPTVYQPPSSQQPPVQIPFSDPFSQQRRPDPFMPNAQSQRRGSYGREHGDRAPLAAGWPPTSGTSADSSWFSPVFFADAAPGPPYLPVSCRAYLFSPFGPLCRSFFCT